MGPDRNSCTACGRDDGTLPVPRDRGDVVLVLTEYERDNLLWLLNVGRKIGLDTGDWLGQIRNRLNPAHEGNPNFPPYSTERLIERMKK